MDKNHILVANWETNFSQWSAFLSPTICVLTRSSHSLIVHLFQREMRKLGLHLLLSAFKTINHSFYHSVVLCSKLWKAAKLTVMDPLIFVKLTDGVIRILVPHILPLKLTCSAYEYFATPCSYAFCQIR